jgi:glycosyltransferase involved in cell wall biosynthesis
MASGRPIVCSDIAGYRQTVGTDGSLLVPPEDPAAIAQAVEQLVVHPGMRDRMGESNYRRAAQFSWERVTISVRNVYLEAMRRRARMVVERELCREESATGSVLGSPLILPTARD